MEGLVSVSQLIKKGDWMTKLDLKDAYLTVPVLKTQWKFVRFIWRSTVFQFKCLPFGLSSAPRTFTKLLKPVITFLRKEGIRLIVYLDDILIVGESQAKTERISREQPTC